MDKDKTTPGVVWRIEAERAYWHDHCLANGVSLDTFELRWKVAAGIYGLAADHPRMPMEDALTRFLAQSIDSGVNEADRRYVFGRVWARILGRQHGDAWPGEVQD